MLETYLFNVSAAFLSPTPSLSPPELRPPSWIPPLISLRRSVWDQRRGPPCWTLVCHRDSLIGTPFFLLPLSHTHTYLWLWHKTDLTCKPNDLLEQTEQFPYIGSSIGKKLETAVMSLQRDGWEGVEVVAWWWWWWWGAGAMGGWLECDVCSDRGHLCRMYTQKETLITQTMRCLSVLGWEVRGGG